MNEPAPTRAVLAAATEHLAAAGVPTPRVDAELLAAYVLDCARSALVLRKAFPAEALGRYWDLLERRAARVPLQHITGEAGFRYLTLEVRPGVFIPRPETETVAQMAIDAAAARPVPALVVDLCTGAGGIAISVATEVPGAKVWAVDLNPQAVALARANAARHGARLDVSVGDVRDPVLLAHLAGQVDVLVANPPYIPFDAEPIDVEVREHDPTIALYGGGEDGLEVPAAVVERARTLLRPGGVLVIEHGDEQGEAMREIVEERGGFTAVRTEIDLTGRERMVLAQRTEVAH